MRIPQPQNDLDKVIDEGLSAVDKILNRTPDEQRRDCIERLNQLVKAHKQCEDKGICEEEPYNLIRPTMEGCSAMACVKAGPKSITYPALEGREGKVHRAPEKLDVCLDSGAEIKGIFNYGSTLYVQTNDRRFGILRSSTAKKESACDYTFEPIASDVSDTFLYNNQMYVAKRQPEASATAGKSVSSLFHVRVGRDNSNLPPGSILGPATATLEETKTNGAESFVSYHGKLFYSAPGKTERLPVEGIASWDGTVEDHRRICSNPKNFKDGVPPKDEELGIRR